MIETILAATLAVTVVRELPVCERTNNGAVIYYEPTKTFMVCDGTTGEWYPRSVGRTRRAAR